MKNQVLFVCNETAHFSENVTGAKPTLNYHSDLQSIMTLFPCAGQFWNCFAQSRLLIVKDEHIEYTLDIE